LLGIIEEGRKNQIKGVNLGWTACSGTFASADGRVKDLKVSNQVTGYSTNPVFQVHGPAKGS
jgi:hypothetical protein